MIAIRRSGSYTYLGLELAGVPVRFRWPAGGRFVRVLADRYAPFKARSASWFFDAAPRTRYGRRPSEVRLEETGGRLRVERSDFSADVDLRSRRGRLEVGENPYTFDSFLRVFYSWLLPRLGGLVVHGASLVRGPRGYLFPAVSGGGKSTLTRMAGRRAALTDELSLLRREAGRYWLYGSPFWGQMAGKGRPSRVPLAGVYFLKKGPKAETRPVPAASSARRLLATVMTFNRTRAGVDRVMGVIESLASSAECRELTFAKGRPFWQALGYR